MGAAETRIKKILSEAPELSDYVIHCRSVGNAERTIKKQLESLLALRRACGTVNSPVAVFCQECGKPIMEPQAQAQIEELEKRLARPEAVYTERLTLKKE